jgi:hypothetical protein
VSHRQRLILIAVTILAWSGTTAALAATHASL